MITKVDDWQMPGRIAAGAGGMPFLSVILGLLLCLLSQADVSESFQLTLRRRHSATAVWRTPRPTARTTTTSHTPSLICQRTCSVRSTTLWSSSSKAQPSTATTSTNAVAPQPLRGLYPPIAPFRNGTFTVHNTVHRNDPSDDADDTSSQPSSPSSADSESHHHHTLYYEQYGNPHGRLALVLHGGPGAGCFARHAQCFDPTVYHIVLLDQRGAGRSTPRGSVGHNTLAHLVQDIHHLRQRIAVESSSLPMKNDSDQNSKTNSTVVDNTTPWGCILGGSWGSALAVAYAQTYPQHVRALVLRGVCLLRPQEVDWLLERPSSSLTATSNDDDDKTNGNDSDSGRSRSSCHVAAATASTTTTRHQNRLAAWHEFEAAVGVSNTTTTGRRETLHAYYDRLFSDNKAVQLQAAQAWMRYEMRISSLHRPQQQQGRRNNNTTGATDSAEVSTTTNTAKSDKSGSQTAINEETTLAQQQQPQSRVLVGYPLTTQHNDDDTMSSCPQEHRTWEFYTPDRTLCEADEQGRSATEYLHTLGNNLSGSTQDGGNGRHGDDDDPQWEIRPVRPVRIDPEQNTTAVPKEYANFIPAQAMLTCFYSVHDRYAMNHVNLLDHMAAMAHIPCIAVQGGLDNICPVDTALELAQVYPAMEVRIPQSGGHSMYDPPILHELVQATDLFGQL